MIIKQTHLPNNKGVLINLSNHKVNTDCFNSILTNFNLDSLDIYNCPALFNFEKDIWKQVEGILESLSKAKAQSSESKESCFEREGTKFLLVPAATVGAVMLTLALYKIWGIGPYICLVGKNRQGNVVLKQVLDLEAFTKKAQSNLRAKYIFGDSPKTEARRSGKVNKKASKAA